jgi:hypothetical protein
MAPQFVKPYVKTNKNDAADAEAICEAVRPWSAEPALGLAPRVHFPDREPASETHQGQRGRLAQKSECTGAIHTGRPIKALNAWQGGGVHVRPEGRGLPRVLVKEELKKIGKGKPLAPVLLVCGDMSKGIPLIVADGYHRICAVCHYDEFAPIACQMVEN